MKRIMLKTGYPFTRRWFLPKYALLLLLLFVFVEASSQRGAGKWSDDGITYFTVENNEVVSHTLPDDITKVLVSKAQITPEGTTSPLEIENFSFTGDQSRILIFTNTSRVWRLNTRGDYWVMDLQSGELKQLGRSLPASSLMFAKFSPDGTKAAYVCRNNIYVEDLESSQITQLTNDGTITLINGTFDWVYEEEFFCRDGFRWSPDSKSIAYWQLDAGAIKKFYLINNTDSIYSKIIPIEYPKVGQDPSACRVGVIGIDGAQTTWMDVPGAPDQNYIVRMEFIPSSGNILIQQLNRRQNTSKLFIANPRTGTTEQIYEESDKAWVDMYTGDDNTYAVDYTNSFTWYDNGRSILWLSEKDGWRHLYKLSLTETKEELLTVGDYDVIAFKYADAGYAWFMASPENATQDYLYRVSMKGGGEAQKVTPEEQKGTHSYSFSPTGKYAFHSFTNNYTRPTGEYLAMPKHKPLDKEASIESKLSSQQQKRVAEFFTITTIDSVEMDGWMVKPADFDPQKKYPVVFYVYTEPAATTVTDTYGAGRNMLYMGDMAKEGYIYISLDNRGTPAPKGRAWRKAIYRNCGQVNIRDQAMAAREILKWSFVDPERIAVWGWSGGGSATLNLMFQYPDIYKTGIAIAAVSNLLTYDNIYQERYMGLPQENMEDFIKGSPVTYAKNLKGNLLFIHGTGDDNVHYQNAEMLINELVKYNKQFQVMPYPNRTHGISEGEGTLFHLATLYTGYLRKNCPPGGR